MLSSDVLLMKKYSWKPEGGAPIIEDIPEEEMDKAMELHAALVEAAAENDEGLMEKFFESESLTEDELREGIRKGLVTRSIFPVFCVCAGKSYGRSPPDGVLGQCCSFRKRDA